MNTLIVILDGLGDRPNKLLGGKTPLEAARKPNLNWLCKGGRTGIMYPVKRGVAPESDEAALALLGYDPFRYHRGRGPLEALGYGVKFRPGEVVLRCNFMKVHNGWVTDFQFKPDEKKVKEYVEKINKIKIKGVKLKFAKTLGHRAVLILEGPLSDRISNTHPGYRIVKNYVSSAMPRKGPLKLKKCRPLTKDKKAKRTAEIINEFVKKSNEVLGDDLFVVTRGAGSCTPKLEKKYRNWVLMGDSPVEKAIGKLTGMKVVKKPEDLEELAHKVEKLIKKHSIYVQIKGPDSWAHKNRPLKKKKSVEEIDRKFFSKIKDLDAKLCVTADHSTPCEIRAHSQDPVPVLIYYPQIKPDKVKEFSEKSCRKGSLGTFRGVELMKKIKSA